jgi:hypothetical protein
VQTPVDADYEFNDVLFSLLNQFGKIKPMTAIFYRQALPSVWTLMPSICDWFDLWGDTGYLLTLGKRLIIVSLTSNHRQFRIGYGIYQPMLIINAPTPKSA